MKYRYDPPGEYGQKDPTVVLFREENLRTLGTSFPVPYEVHAVILKELSNHRPRAVFVDFAFMDERSEEEVAVLVSALRALNEAGTSVYLAVPAPNGKESKQILSALLAGGYAKGGQPKMDTEHGVSGVLTYQNGVAIGRHSE